MKTEIPKEINDKFKELYELHGEYPSISIVALAQSDIRNEGAYQTGVFACSAADLYFAIGTLISKLAQAVDRTPVQVVDELMKDMKEDDEQFIPQGKD